MTTAASHDHLASLEEVFRATAQKSGGDRLRAFLQESGVAWHDSPDGSCDFVSKASSRIVSLGGVPLVAHRDGLALATSPDRLVDVEAYRDATHAMMGFSGMMSYLNPADRSPGDMFEMLRARNDLSVAHAVSVSILVSGVSVAVENEFNSQRDIMHLARLTVARTAVQSDPPLVVHDAKDLPAFRQALDLARSLRKSTPTVDRDDLESINLLFPAAKATAFIMTGSLRNFLKLLQHQQDTGKEREYRSTLASIRRNLNHVWPTLF